MFGKCMGMTRQKPKKTREQIIMEKLETSEHYAYYNTVGGCLSLEDLEMLYSRGWELITSLGSSLSYADVYYFKKIRRN